MVYTSNNWLSGDVITAAKINNLETQYTQSKLSFIERFSTASTGTRVFSLFPTSQAFAAPADYVLGHLYMPTHWQKSKFEFSFNCQVISTAAALGNNNFYFYDYDSTTLIWASVAASYSNAPNWSTGKGTVTLFPGRVYALSMTPSTNCSIKCIYLSGVSTDATITPASPGLLFTTRSTDIGTYFSTAAT
jgi:hypothetical protein